MKVIKNDVREVINFIKENIGDENILFEMDNEKINEMVSQSEGYSLGVDEIDNVYFNNGNKNDINKELFDKLEELNTDIVDTVSYIIFLCKDVQINLIIAGLFDRDDTEKFNAYVICINIIDEVNSNNMIPLQKYFIL